MTRVCVLGSINVDLVVRAPRFPAPGETLLGGPFATYAGGKGANQAVAAARLGAQTSLVGAVGDDDQGRRRLAELAAEGVDVTRVQIRAGVATGTASITVCESGENTIVVAPGANALVSGVDVEAAREVLAAADVLVAQLELPVETVTRAAQIARELGTPLLLNAAPAVELPRGVAALVDLLVVNRGEARVLAGRPAARTAAEDARVELDALAGELLALGARQVIVTLGPGGAVWWAGAERHAAVPPEVDATDTTGCGDAFVGALASAWGTAPRKALALACRAGAFAATRAGAAGSFPFRAELRRS